MFWRVRLRRILIFLNAPVSVAMGEDTHQPPETEGEDVDELSRRILSYRTISRGLLLVREPTISISNWRHWRRTSDRRKMGLMLEEQADLVLEYPLKMALRALGEILEWVAYGEAANGAVKLQTGRYRDESERILDDIKAVIEETELSIGEIKKETNSFRRENRIELDEELVAEISGRVQNEGFFINNLDNIQCFKSSASPRCLFAKNTLSIFMKD
ncbi:hypothetical protein GOP47_0030295 [Adiantum capillus-veneris]|nr:hypothetical protein GOP47_0030295 [Adiantum capillus-veneris]